jgi:hypothetical protein
MRSVDSRMRRPKSEPIVSGDDLMDKGQGHDSQSQLFQKLTSSVDLYSRFALEFIRDKVRE